MKTLQYILIIISIGILIYPKEGLPFPFWVKGVAFFYAMYTIMKLLKKLPSKHDKTDEKL
jgi:hypothetical protein